MKVLVLTLLTIAVAFAIPVELDTSDESQLTLVDLDHEQPIDENSSEVTRDKRFILKKIALAKAGILGVGALGLAGAVAAKSGGNGLGGIFNGNSGSQQVYGPAYSYGAAPSLSTSVPSSTFYTSQTYVPPQTYAPPPPPPPPQSQVIYGVPQQQQTHFNPIGAAIQWKSGIVNGITNGISGGFGSAASIIGLSPPIAAQASYSYAPIQAAVPSVQVGPVGPPPPLPQPIAAGQNVPVPNKPVYVVCDSNN